MALEYQAIQYWQNWTWPELWLGMGDWSQLGFKRNLFHMKSSVGIYTLVLWLRICLLLLLFFGLGSIILFPYFQIFFCVLMIFFYITDVTLACLIGEDIKSLRFGILNHQHLRICNLEDSGSWILKIYIIPIFRDLRILSPEDIESWGFYILRIWNREIPKKWHYLNFQDPESSGFEILLVNHMKAIYSPPRHNERKGFICLGVISLCISWLSLI